MPKLSKTFKERMGSRIQERRKEMAWSQEDLADRCDCERDTIQKFETGKRTPSTPMFCKISEALNMPIDYFVYDGKHISSTYLEMEYAEKLGLLSPEFKQMALEQLDALKALQDKLAASSEDDEQGTSKKLES